MHTWHRAMLGCAMLLMLTLRPVEASVMPAWSIDQLTEFSSAVVTGRVVNRGAFEAQGCGAVEYRDWLHRFETFP